MQQVARSKLYDDSIQHHSIFIKRYRYRQLELQDKLYRNTGHKLWPGHNTIVYFMFCFVKLVKEYYSKKNIIQRSTHDNVREGNNYNYLITIQ